MTEDGVIHIGKHRLLIEAADLMTFVVDGDVSPEEIRAVNEEAGKFEQGKDFILFLLDISRMGPLSMETRRAVSRARAMQRCRGMVVYGIPFPQRTIAMLVVKAFSLLSGNVDMSVAFFDTEAEARAWLSERRSSLLRGA